MHTNQPQVPLENILVTEELQTRPSREPDYQVENEALREISRKLSESPRASLQALVDQALKICNAQSAGISLEEREGENEIFRWHATTGQLAPFLNATMPRHFSPCGAVVDQRATLLMREMVRHYDYVSGLGLPLFEVLLVPFFLDGKPIGTVWAVLHTNERQFEKEDQRLLQSLAEFTAGITQAYFNSAKMEKNIKQLQQERDIRERFVGALTHDLRTPLTAAKLRADLMMRTCGDHLEVKRGLSRIAANMERADRMILDLLDSNRLNAGERIPVTPTLCKLDEILETSMREMRDLHGPRFELSTPEKAIAGQWDRDGLQRIVDNLVSNAVKYGTPDRPIKIALAQNGSEVELSVHNEGNPIPAQDLETLFAPYHRTESAVKGGHRGWGIGLAIVKGIAEAHLGRVGVRSAVGEGTTFYVTLPV